MAKSKALINAEAKIAALEARLEVATQVYRTQRACIGELEAALATRGVKPAVVKPQPAVTQFTKADGSVWVKERVGNTARVYQRQ